MRAVWRAGRWLSQDSSRTAAAELLARKQWLDVPSELIDRSLTGQLTISQTAEQRHIPGFLEFHKGAAPFPWKSQGKWIARQIAMRTGLDPSDAMAAAASVFRSDLYRNALANTGADLPGASEKIEGSLSHATPVASGVGAVILARDVFFDGRVFDPDRG